MKKTKKSFLHSIRFEMLAMGIIPLMALSLVCVLVSVSSLKSGMQDEALGSLRTLCTSVKASYDSLNDQPYVLSEDGHLLKGDWDISADPAELDCYTEGLESDVTFFYGDVRKATSLIDTATGERIVGTTASPEVSAAVLSGQEYSSTDLVINNQNYYAYYLPLKNPDGSIVGMVFAGEPSEEIDSFISQKIAVIVGSAVLITMIAALCTLLIALKLAAAVAGAKEAVDHLSEGVLSYEVSDRVLKRKDEIGDMARSVSACTETLRKIVGDIQHYAAEVLDSGDKLETMANQTSQNATDITSAIEDISKGAVSQAQEIETATMNVGNMGDLISDIVSQIEQLNETSAEMQSAGTKAMEIIQELGESNDKTAEAVLSVAKTVEATDESVNRISEAVELITSVASQTNLLSLNASIEAARAGEAGRGFAVVASEIQKLSEESNASANRISEIIKGLAEDSKRSMSTMEEVKTRLSQQQEKMEDTMRQFDDVSAGIVSTKDGAEAINGQAYECDMARGTVVDVIQNLSAISEENAASTQETNASMEELNATISLVASASEQLKSLAEALEEATRFFQM